LHLNISQDEQLVPLSRLFFDKLYIDFPHGKAMKATIAGGIVEEWSSHSPK
jgi:hypothetical protein